MTDREQFEAWIRSKYPIADFERGNDGSYIVADLESRWESWQAANALMRQYADRNPFMTIGHFAEHVAARAAPAQHDLTVPEEKAIDAALFAGSKTVSPQTSDGSHWAIKTPAQPVGERPD